MIISQQSNASENKLKNVNKYKRDVKNQQLVINDDKKVCNLQFVEDLEVNNLTIVKCPNIVIQSLPWRVVELRIYESCLQNVQDIDNMRQLTVLDLNFNYISELGFLNNLHNITKLYLYANRIRQLKPLEGLQNLQHLNLGSNRISNIQPLSKLNKLVYLNLGNNQIRDISALRQMTDLQELYLLNNQIGHTKALSYLKNLKWLDLSNNQITSVPELKSMCQLGYLNVSCNKLICLSPINSLTQLKKLYIATNFIINMSPVKHMDLLNDVERETLLEPTKELVLENQHVEVVYRTFDQLDYVQTNFKKLKQIMKINTFKISSLLSQLNQSAIQFSVNVSELFTMIGLASQ
ncbi:Conserved_hypothetical protein [Hexamita inflata]|uniref:Uncharacterized protein n=1 Tax=Hexamita inflata TaxID=28002 RepID=A0ABP1JYK5_9EUKA